MAELLKKIFERKPSPEEFREIHSSCKKVQTIFVKMHPRGSIHQGFSASDTYRAPSYEYFLKCSDHDSRSASFDTVKPLPRVKTN